MREGLPTNPGLPGGPTDHKLTSGWASRPLPNIQNGIPITNRFSGEPPHHSRTLGGLPTIPGHLSYSPICKPILNSIRHFGFLRKLSSVMIYTHRRYCINTGWMADGDRSHEVRRIQQGLHTNPGYPAGPPGHSRTSGRASRPLPDIRRDFRLLPHIWEGRPTTPGHPGWHPDY